MKKLTVGKSELDNEYTYAIAEFLTSQYMYGQYDFDAERLVEDVCRQYDLRLSTFNHPMYILKDEDENAIEIEMKEEFYG